jgi:hypothetical protein
MPSGRKRSKRWWGYFVWIGAALMVAVPEITAASFSRDTLGFITISETVGHLERYHNWIELGVIGVIVAAVVSLVRIPPRQSGAQKTAAGAARTPGGRITFHSTPGTTKHPSTWDEEAAPWIFLAAAIVAAGLVAFGGWATAEWWDDARRFHVSFVIYVSLATLWFVIPGLLAVFAGEDVPFPTMFRTVHDLEDWLKGRSWRWMLGPKLAWLVTPVIFWGLVVLLIHLTLYPYPNITDVLNPNG